MSLTKGPLLALLITILQLVDFIFAVSAMYVG